MICREQKQTLRDVYFGIWNICQKRKQRVHKSWNATRDVSHHSGGERGQAQCSATKIKLEPMVVLFIQAAHFNYHPPPSPSSPSPPSPSPSQISSQYLGLCCHHHYLQHFLFCDLVCQEQPFIFEICDTLSFFPSAFNLFCCRSGSQACQFEF